jgi:signal peptidase I
VIVDGNSMYKTLQNGDKGITDGLFYKIFGIDRFDIVIIEQKGFSDKLVKRVIGLPGETVRYEKGVLYINGEVVKESFITEEVAKQTITMYGNDTFECRLGNDEYYVLGDNRGHSTDSRYFGPIKESQIKGDGLMLFASCSSVSENGDCKGLKLRWPKFVD